MKNTTDTRFIDEWNQPKEKHTRVIVESLPTCDFCSNKAKFDARTKMGAWANLCDVHFKLYGIKLGIGFGQKLISKEG